MDPRYVAVIDIGKTNAKLAVVDCETWIEVAVKSTPNTVLSTPPYPHFDTDGIWQFLINALQGFAAEYDIGAISITTHGATGALLDVDGALAMPILDYEFDGLDEANSAYERARPLFAETGSPRLPGGLNLGAQFHWQMTSFPEKASRVRTIIMYPQYWAHRLTGVAANEVTSLGCHTDLWNPWAGDFSSLVDTMQWRPLMAPVCEAGETIGTISGEVSKQTGLTPTTPVFCGIHDSNASLYPHLLGADGPLSVVSTGTWIICMAVEGTGRSPDPKRDTLVNVNALGQPVPSARFMGGREFDILMAGGNSEYTEQDVTSVIENGIMHMPSVEHGSGPFPQHDSEWIQANAMNAGERYVAVSYYLALMTNACLELCGADGRVAVEGPFARNQPYLDMLAAVTKHEVSISGSSATGTSIGGAMLTANRLDTSSTPIAPQSMLKVDKSRLHAMRRYAADWALMVDAQ